MLFRSESTGLYTDSLRRSFTTDLSGNFTSVGPTLDMGKIGSLDISQNIGTSISKPLGAVNYNEATNLYTDSIGRSFTADEVMLGKNISMGEQVATTKIDVADSSFRQAAGLPDITGREPTFGDKLKDKFKDAFSPEKLADTGMSLVEDAAIGGLQRLAGQDEVQTRQRGQQYGTRTIGGSEVDVIQYVHEQAQVNLNDSYNNLLYGTADMSHYTPIETQETIKVS